MHAALKIYIDFTQTTTLRLPTREGSKDWRYDGLGNTLSLSDTTTRPYGWLDVKLGQKSSISFVLPMYASKDGYDTKLEILVDQMSMSSSINYETFLMAKQCRVSCQLPMPLVWDALHIWTINVTLDEPELYLLRDHTYLLTDVVRDWTSGPPVDYEHFIPFIYKLNLSLSNFRLNLYLNECALSSVCKVMENVLSASFCRQNIINNAASPDDNSENLKYACESQ